MNRPISKGLQYIPCDYLLTMAKIKSCEQVTTLLSLWGRLTSERCFGRCKIHGQFLTPINSIVAEISQSQNIC